MLRAAITVPLLCRLPVLAQFPVEFLPALFRKENLASLVGHGKETAAVRIFSNL
jgi:hypothetical protein